MLAEVKALEARHDTENPRYMELLIPSYYEQTSSECRTRRGPSQWSAPSAT